MLTAFLLTLSLTLSLACSDAPASSLGSAESPESLESAGSSAPWTRQPSTLTTQVLEGAPTDRVLVDGYSYLLLDAQWVAVPGEVEDEVVEVQALARVEGYHSKQLDRTFESLVFGYLKSR